MEGQISRGARIGSCRRDAGRGAVLFEVAARGRRLEGRPSRSMRLLAWRAAARAARRCRWAPSRRRLCASGSGPIWRWCGGQELRIKAVEVADMCATCGCSGDGVRVEGRRPRPHEHDHHDHDHTTTTTHTRTTTTSTTSTRPARPLAQAGQDGRLERDVLAKNDPSPRTTAAGCEGRESWRSTHELHPAPARPRCSSDHRGDRRRVAVAVIEGDQATRRRRTHPRGGRRAIQVNTGTGVTWTRPWWRRPSPAGPGGRSLLFIENVGNLVCPALFDLGENARVVSRRSPRVRTSRSSTRTCFARPTWCCSTGSTSCRT